MDLPSVSILTPVYDRKMFLPLMIENLKNFEYPKNKLEWVICDSYSRDGLIADPLFNFCRTQFSEIKKYEKEIGFPIKYEFLEKTMSIGEKRNYLVKISSFKYLINMDSDDLYFPEYIRYSIGEMKKYKKECVGSPEMLFIFPRNENKITMIKCPAMRQIHEATMCFTKKHVRRMGGFNTTSQGEGAKLVDNCNPKIFKKTDIKKCMICVCGEWNTINKDKFLDYNNCEESINRNIDHFKVLDKIFSHI
jgi:glycosyltransferase involved in cell wall biosynthesis